MRRFCLLCLVGIAILAFLGLAQQTPAGGPYKVSKKVKVGGAGTFDTVLADTAGRRLYIPRKNPGRITVFNLDTLEPVGEIPDAGANPSSAAVTLPDCNCGSVGSRRIRMINRAVIDFKSQFAEKGAGMGDTGGKKDKEKNKQQQLTKQKQ